MVMADNDLLQKALSYCLQYMNFWKSVWKWSVIHSIHNGHHFMLLFTTIPNFGILTI